MARSLPDLDQDLAAVEKDVGTLKTDVGNLRTDVGNLQQADTKHTADISALTTMLGKVQGPDVATQLKGLNAQVTSMQSWLKIIRPLVFGLVFNAAVVKFDIQAFKIDLTLFKKVDEKNFNSLRKLHELTDRLGRRIHGKLSKKSAEKQREEDRKREEKARLDEQKKKVLEGLPGRVTANENDIERILRALRGARESAGQVRDRHTPDPRGVDGKRPRIAPVTQDVRNLRSAVDQLIGSLGSL
ncbi:hypothetical protein ACIBCM_19360 [Streptomyces sp. NPDC051018]|uniref:hypothetical protein n=1 Tax=Streptomyces sp. NPDC051018 TaxID=3365639 RepID=UPI00378A38AD